MYWIPDLDIQDDTATGGGVDYTAPGITLVTFQPHVDYVVKTFTIKADNIREETESFTVTLDTPSGGVIDVPTTTTVYIMDETGNIALNRHWNWEKFLNFTRTKAINYMLILKYDLVDKRKWQRYRIDYLRVWVV